MSTNGERTARPKWFHSAMRLDPEMNQPDFADSIFPKSWASSIAISANQLFQR